MARDLTKETAGVILEKLMNGAMIVNYESLIGKFVHLFNKYAITFGHHVYTAHKFLTETELKHEYCHVLQYEKYGFFGFLMKYMWYQMKYGYDKNPLEVEAIEYEISGPTLNKE
jgi:hypothetical protein